jgi:hypothetical protein
VGRDEPALNVLLNPVLNLFQDCFRGGEDYLDFSRISEKRYTQAENNFFPGQGMLLSGSNPHF